MGYEVPRLRWAVFLFSLCFGATSLALGVACTRAFCAVFGSTPAAVATLLVVFGLALALGGPVIGHVADCSRRLLALYGCLEIGIGLYALVFALVVVGSSTIYGWLGRVMEPDSASLTVWRIGVSLALLPPAFLMGGALAVLGRLVSTQGPALGRAVAYVGAAVMAGATAGCFASGFLLLRAFGTRGTLVAAGLARVGVGVLALGLWRTGVLLDGEVAERARSTCHEAEGRGGLEGARFRVALLALGVSGFCALAYKVLWSYILGHGPAQSVYSFPTISTTFLAGIAAGAFLSARFLVLRMRRPLLCCGAIEGLIGVGGLISLILLMRLAAIEVRLVPYLRWADTWQPVLLGFAQALVITIVPTLLIGVVFAIVTTSCLGRDATLGLRIGELVVACAVGSVLGWISARFILLGVLGAHYGFLTVAAINLILAVILVRRAGARSIPVYGTIALAVAVVAGTALSVRPPGLFYNALDTHHDLGGTVFIGEHAAGTVAVHELAGGDQVLSVSGIHLAGTSFKMRTMQKLRGYIPLGLYANPKWVLQFGFGCGETVRVGLGLGVENYTVVEAVAGVFDAAGHFEQINQRSYDDPRVRKVVADGRSYALLSGETYDIVVDCGFHSNPGAELLTVDHFRNCRNRLRKGGLYACCLGTDCRPRELYVILAGFQEIFPYASIWVAGNCVNRHCLLVGSTSPQRIDVERFATMMRRPDVAKDLAGVEIHDVYDLLSCHLCDTDAIRRMIDDAEQEMGRRVARHTDDRPLLELGGASRPTGDACVRDVLSVLAAYRSPVSAHVVNLVDPERDETELARRFEAMRHILGGQVWELYGYPAARRQAFAAALKANAGEARVRSNEAEMAREIQGLQRAVTARPSDHALAERLAYKLFMAMRYPEAAAVCERLVQLKDPPSPNVFIYLAEIRFHEGKAIDAEGLLRSCLARWPHCADAHDRLAPIYVRMNRINAARYHVEQAVRLAPDNRLYRQHYAQVMRTQ